VNLSEEKKKLKKFSTDYQPKRKGGKPSLLKKYIRENNISLHDQIKIFKNILSDTTYQELQHIVKTGKELDGEPVSALVWGFCLAFMADCKRGMKQAGIFSQMLDREHGKVSQPIKVDGSLEITQISPEERDRRIQELLSKTGVGNDD
jgi:hypothetical protein